MKPDLQQRTRHIEAVQQLLEKRADILSEEQKRDVAAGDVLDLLTFSVGKERYGLDIQYVREVQPLKRQMWSRVPCTPDFIVGAVSIRGRIYSMMNVAAYFKVGETSVPEPAHAILVRTRSIPGQTVMECCILADDRPGLKQVLISEIQAPVGAVSGEIQAYVKGVTPDMLVILDIGQLLSDPGIIVDDETI